MNNFRPRWSLNEGQKSSAPKMKSYYVTSYSDMQEGFQKRLNSQKIPTGSMSSNKAFFMPVHTYAVIKVFFDGHCI